MNGLSIWWAIAVLISSVNLVVAWIIGVRALRQDNLDTKQRSFIRTIEVLGLTFVSIAFYRSIFASSYPSFLSWFDTILNSPLIVRSLAFFAELSFNGIIALLLLRMNEKFPLRNSAEEKTTFYTVLEKTPLFAFGCIFVSQFFAFGGLLAQNNLLFAIEETLWVVAFASIAPLVVVRLLQSGSIPSGAKKYKGFLVILAIWCTGYLAFQCFYALPFMHYVNLAGWPHGIVLADAFKQALFGYTTTHDFATWGGIGFFIWHTGYFSICSWMVLYFMTVPKGE